MRPVRPFVQLLWLAAALLVLLTASACDPSSATTPTPVVPTPTLIELVEPTNTPVPLPTDTPVPTAPPTSTPIPVSERGFVPILCYHHIREWTDDDRGDNRAYVVPPSILEDTLKYLKDEGYQGVTAEQVYEYYADGRPLPDKPIMLSFDDSDDNQYTNALPLLKKYGFTATFFIMTVTIDKENYMTSEQLKDLSAQGFDIQAHTWDHRMVTKLETDEEWETQIVEPKKALGELLGQPVDFLAYPFGVYNAEAGEKLKQSGYKAAFRLSEDMDDEADPVYSIIRYIANPFWIQAQLESVLAGEWE